MFEKIYQNVILKHSKYEKFKDSPQDLLKELEKDPEVFQEMVQVAMRELSQGDITKFMEVMNPDIMDAQMQHFMGEVRNLFNKFDTEGKSPCKMLIETDKCICTDTTRSDIVSLSTETPFCFLSNLQAKDIWLTINYFKLSEPLMSKGN